ncbi:MAG: DNA mismatch repair protein MutS [Deltaproteobacteria bacterium]|nr:DNA mismatch repair protein MutS [Deltaproteobacteria bacterium]MBW2594882.1 DNA mismatch repair protein MutS [Deltaproteobacteria bacterium]
MKNLTPAMRQYLEIKEAHRDCIIFFRMGDFYEMFFEDAEIASRVLEITLTSRNKGKENAIPLCGVPWHAASAYISKLIENGHKVAICEQMEDPKDAKGIVKREVVRIVTPGLVVDSDNLSAKENNFLAGISALDGSFGLAFVDISTGEFRVTESDDREAFLDEIAGLEFREVVVREDLKESDLMEAFAIRSGDCSISFLPSDYFSVEGASDLIDEFFSEKREVDFDGHPAMTGAAGAVLRYVKETQKDRLNHINDVLWYDITNYLVLDDTAKKNLELFATIQGGRKRGSLFHVLDETTTAMGGRKLRWWLNYPLVDPDRIRIRLAAVSEIKEEHLLRENLRASLAGIYDLERLGSRVSMGVANGRDLLALGRSLRLIPAIKDTISELESSLISSICGELDDMPDVADLIGVAIVDDPPVTIRDGYVIKKGYDDELDKLISLCTDGKKWIAAMEGRERKRTGIGGLKVGFNNVFGYYIEVTKANSDMVPEDYVRKQTLVNAERYINQELKEYEVLVLGAEERRKKREYELFVDIRERIAREIMRIQRTASRLADLDAIASLAEVAEMYNYCCPRVNDEDMIKIKGGRHPVVERMNPNGGFVPNDTLLDRSGNRFLIITGPNMAGKSTYIRQTAVIVLMAQMGSFVPADEAEIGIVDRIFTRVGAGDSLSGGQSTFMVEMTEVAGILKNASLRSLILLDEVGRGTSTFDGLSIAWAVSEHIHDPDKLGARTLFATHYHELTDLARTMDGVRNLSIAVKEWGDRVIFLRTIVEGGTNRSYGIEVARLAGVHEDVISRAREVLGNLEKGELDEIGMPRIARGKPSRKGGNVGQLDLFAGEENPDMSGLINELKGLDVLNMTPMEALGKISEWQKMVKD